MKQEVQDELKRIHDRDGGLEPAVVLDEARDEGSILHGLFEWDDAKAGHQFRLDQARGIIRVAVVVISEVSNAPVREYININDEQRGRAYRETQSVLTDKRLYELAKRDALLQLSRLGQRYRHIQELSPIWNEVTRLAEAMLEKPEKKKRAA